VQQAVADALPNLGGGGPQYGDFSRQIHISTASQTEEGAGEQQVDTVRQGKREAMRQEGIPTSQQPTSQVSTEGGRQAVYEVPKAGGGTQTKVVTVNHNDSSHPDQTHVEAGNAKANGQTDSLGA
jgi:hypothetical protein